MTRLPWPSRKPQAAGLEPAELTEIRAALAAGGSPAMALGTADKGVLAPIARAVRLGRPIAAEAATLATGDPGADLLVRALGVAERAGVGGGQAVDQALRAVRENAAMARLLRVRTAQARGTAWLLTLVPVVAWVLLVGMDPRALAFYGTAVGLVTGLCAVGLGTGARMWSSRLVGRAEQAAVRADPLVPAPPARDLGRGVAVGVPILLAVGLAVGPAVGLLAAVAAGLWFSRPGQAQEPGPQAAVGGGTPETVELVAVAIAAGLPTAAAVDLVAPLAPPAARDPMAAAARRLRGGWTAEAAFAGTGLASLGRVLAIADRWGAPAGEALRGLADELRADRTAAAEEAAERVQLALVFPTTLLTLPAFILGVVPPLLWTAFAG